MSSRSTGRSGRRVRELSPGELGGAADGKTESSASGQLPSASGRVLHFDQLDEGSQLAFLRLLRDEPANLPLPAGTVVVFTGYYRVECA